MTAMFSEVSALAGQLVAQAEEIAQEASRGGEDTNAVPYVIVLIIGFLVGAYGHGMKSKVLIALGIAIIILAIVLFQIEVLNTSPDKLPPGV
jgi:hypothetical protein